MHTWHVCKTTCLLVLRGAGDYDELAGGSVTGFRRTCSGRGMAEFEFEDPASDPLQSRLYTVSARIGMHVASARMQEQQ
jgi:hypothetical protein